MHRASKPLEDTQQASCLEATQQTVPQPNITAFYRNLCSLPQTKNLHRLISWRPRFGESGSHWSHFEWPELSWPDLPSAFNEGVRSRQTKRLVQFFKELLWLKIRTRSLQKQILQCNSSRFPCCVLLALSWNTNENPITDKLRRAIDYFYSMSFSI